MDRKWKEVPSPKSKQFGSGWCRELNKAYIYEGKYAAMTREIQTTWGKVIHCAIRNDLGTDMTWKEKQWIKDSLFGEDRVAIEVFPAKDRLVDEANMYHIWILPQNFEIPFGIHNKDASERSKYES